MTRAYYNENDPKAAAWLRELIAQGEITDGDVDDRDIRDVCPDDLRGFTECHFFAGIGVWSRAKRDAGFETSGQFWSGSCPCQPFSAAGRGKGIADERHLWPHWFHLIEVCRPDIVVGEQVASKDGLAWLDLVQADMEGSGYAIGASDLCAAGFGAPHIRQRLYFAGVADAASAGLSVGHVEPSGAGRVERSERLRADVGLGNTERPGPQGLAGHGIGTQGRDDQVGPCIDTGVSSRMANPDGRDASAEWQQPSREQRQQPQDGGSVERMGDTNNAERRAVATEGDQCDGPDTGRTQGSSDVESAGGISGPGPTNGAWRAADWLRCRDENWRPVEPGTFPLADGITGRVGLLRGYGNAIVLPQATAYLEALGESLYEIARAA